MAAMGRRELTSYRCRGDQSEGPAAFQISEEDGECRERGLLPYELR